MVDVFKKACHHLGCFTRPGHGWEGTKTAIYCAKHAPAGMWPWSRRDARMQVVERGQLSPRLRRNESLFSAPSMLKLEWWTLVARGTATQVAPPDLIMDLKAARNRNTAANTPRLGWWMRPPALQQAPVLRREGHEKSHALQPPRRGGDG